MYIHQKSPLMGEVVTIAAPISLQIILLQIISLQIVQGQS